MKKRVSIVIVFVLLFCSGTVWTQEKRAEGKKEYKKITDANELTLSEVGLTEEQNKKVEYISATYRDEILQVRSKLAVKQGELRGYLRDPEMDAKKIQAVACDLRILHVKLHKMMINYQLEIRDVLTPEQVRSWSTLENPPVKRGRRQ